MSYKIRTYTFNPFQENTYVVYDSNLEAIIIDPGCYTKNEKNTLLEFIRNEGLKIRAIFNTHGHIDHIFGNAHLVEQFQVDIYTHRGELATIHQSEEVAKIYGFNEFEVSPIPTKFIDEGDHIQFGEISFKVLYVPGHSIAHIAFYDEVNGQLFGGDVLFKGSFGRTDLPGGDLETLKTSIIGKFFLLPSKTIVYPGHGPRTTIGEEKEDNPIYSY